MSSEEVKSEVEKAPGLYSALFQFPSFKLLIVASILLSILIGIFAEIFITSFDFLFSIFNGIFDGLFVFFAPIVITSLLSYLIVKKSTPMLNLRRIFAASILDTILWGFFYIIGAIFSLILANPLLVIDGFCLGLALSLTLRILLFFSLSFTNTLQSLLISFLKPLLGLGFIFLLFITPLYSTFLNFYYWIPRIISVSSVAGVGVFIFKHFVDKQMKDIVGIKSTTFLKSFMASWLEDQTSYMEELFKKLGKNKDISIGLIKFNGDNHKNAFIIPSIHPGPFRTVGSSNLPFMLSSNLENKFVDYATIFHGPSTHALNLSSSDSTYQILDEIENQIKKCKNDFLKISPFIRKENEDFNAGCQFFGDLALVCAFAKRDTEDISPIVVKKLKEKISSIDIKEVILIDCHNNKKINSTRQPIAEANEVNNLVDLCFDVINDAKKLPLSNFSLGSSRFVFNQNLRSKGIGDSGIISNVIKVNNQKMVYVVLDGNNMISGLRDKIRDEILKLGFSECEVMTTDTHTVDGVSLESSNMLGLHYPENEIIEKVLISVNKASENMVDVEEGCYSIFEVKNIRVAGDSVEKILKGTINAMKVAKKIILPILLLTIIISIIFLILL